MANLLQQMKEQKQAARQAEIYRNLIRKEAKIGGKLFGPVDANRHREFFCLDPHTWVWHEEWTEGGQRQVVTTRYDVRPNGIIKSQNGANRRYLDKDEARNLYQAAQLYNERVNAELYSALAA